ncbi:MAG: dihydrofolate reductase [Rhodomicrobium sp.]|nr:dihydrofolate reductase [Rhodomicrobium sp.]
MTVARAPFTLSLVVAVADNGVIGRGSKLPWRLGSDLKRFRQLTMGHPLIMGRQTFESIGKPLDGRDSIVVTSASAVPHQDGLFFAPSLEQAIALAEDCAQARGVTEIFLIGGAKLFSQALPLARRIYLTRVHGSPEGDVRWEPALGDDWIERSREDRPVSARDEFPVTDLVLERAKTA